MNGPFSIARFDSRRVIVAHINVLSDKIILTRGTMIIDFTCNKYMIDLLQEYWRLKKLLLKYGFISLGYCVLKIMI